MMLSVRFVSTTERCGSHVKRVMTNSDETEFMSRYTRYKPNNVWSDLKRFGAHEHGKCGDPFSELRSDVVLMPNGMKASCVGASLLLVFMTLHRLCPCSVLNLHAHVLHGSRRLSSGIDFQTCCLMQS